MCNMPHTNAQYLHQCIAYLYTYPANIPIRRINNVANVCLSVYVLSIRLDRLGRSAAINEAHDDETHQTVTTTIPPVYSTRLLQIVANQNGIVLPSRADLIKIVFLLLWQVLSFFLSAAASFSLSHSAVYLTLMATLFDYTVFLWIVNYMFMRFV